MPPTPNPDCYGTCQCYVEELDSGSGTGSGCYCYAGCPSEYYDENCICPDPNGCCCFDPDIWEEYWDPDCLCGGGGPIDPGKGGGQCPCLDEDENDLCGPEFICCEYATTCICVPIGVCY